jgi:hypothetical protein
MTLRGTLAGPMRHVSIAALALAALLGAAAPLAADGHPFALRVSTVSGAPGQRVDVAIHFEPAGAEISAIALYVEYDPARLVFDPVGANALTTGDPLFRSSFGMIEAGDRRMVGVCIYDPDVPLASLPSGEITLVSFRIADAAAGFVPLTIARDIDAADPAGRKVDPAGATLEAGGVAVTAPLPGGFSATRTRATRPPDPPAFAAAEATLVPIVVRSSGMERWHSMLTLSNPGNTAARLRLSMLSDTREARSITLEPHETRRFDDAVAEIFQALDFSDGVLVESSVAGIDIRCATITGNADSREATAQSIPPVAWRGLPGRTAGATLAGLELARAKSMTLTLLNPERRAIALRIRVLGDDGTEIAQRDVALPPDEARRSIDLAELAAPDDGIVTVEVAAIGDAVFYAYASVSDGSGGMPLFVAPR